MIQLVDHTGQRKYLTETERRAFLEAAKAADPPTRTFALTLAYTGCRISEALALRAWQVDVEHHRITVQTLKRRRSGVYRSVPVPATVTDALDLVHAIRRLQRSEAGRKSRLWPWSRSTGYRYVMGLFEDAGISGPHATPHGLRHAFGVIGVQHAPLNMVQKWMGHAQLTTIAIYTDAVGDEESELASRMRAE